MFRLPFSRMKQIKCPDGTPRFVHRNPEEAYRLTAEKHIADARAAVRGLQSITAEAGLRIDSQIQGFYLHLDKVNSSMQAQLSAIYKTYCTNPCGSWDWLCCQVERILHQESEARRLAVEIEGINALLATGINGEDLVLAVSRVVDRLAWSPAARRAAQVIKQSTHLADEWVANAT